MNHLLYEAQLILDRAEDSLEYAETNLKLDITIIAANRAYYTMFYCINALLVTEDVVMKTHKGAQIKFRELFIKNGKLPREMSTWLSKATELRQTSDYDFTSEISEEVAKDALEDAQEFYKLTKAYLGDLIANAP